MITQQGAVPTAEAAFLRGLFSLLNQRHIRYAVMRNYASLPSSAGGSDLDILLAQDDFETALSLVEEAARMAGGVCVGLSPSPDVTKMHLIGRVQSVADGWWGLKVDLFPGFRFAGLALLDECWSQKNELHGEIRVLPAGLAAVLGVIKEVLNNRVLPERYADAARQALVSEWPFVRSLLSPMGGDALRLLESLLASEHPPAARRRLCAQVQKAVLLNALSRKPLQAMAGLVRFQFSKVARYGKPSGFVMAILGVDGAGKSTVIEAIRPVLNDATHHALLVRHLRPGFLPALGRLKGGQASGGPVTAPHAKAPSGLVLSLVRLLYLAADYVLGYWLLTRPQIARLPNIVVFDRYAYDMVLDPQRFRISLPSRIIAAVVGLVPQPDLVICLYGSAEEISRRKSELSTEETARQINALMEFAGRTSFAVPVSTGQSIDKTRDEVLEAVCRSLDARRAADR